MPEGRGGSISPSSGWHSPSPQGVAALGSLEDSQDLVRRTLPAVSGLKLGEMQTEAASPLWLVELCLLFGDCSWPGHLLWAGGLGFLSANAEAPSVGAEPPPPFVLALSSGPAVKPESPFLSQGRV